MKKFRKLSSLFLVTVLSISFLVGCSNKKSAPVKNTPKEKPTFQEFVKAFKNTDISYYVDSLKEHLADLKEISIEDFEEFKSQVAVLYGNSDITLPDELTEYTNIADVGKLTSYPHTTRGDNDAIVIVKGATLHKTVGNKEVKEEINIVALQGTDVIKEQATGIKEDLLVGMELNNYYLYDAFLAITNNIEEGSTLYIAGLSLGGMVAQQLAGVDYLKENYNVKYVSAIGSPLISPEMIDYKETSVSRFVIENDIVPTLSNSATENEWNKKQNLAVEDSQIYKTFIGAHTFGYVNEDIWGNYDVLGVKGGNARITFESIEKVSLHPVPNRTANKK